MIGRQREVVVILGQTGGGKTRKAAEIIAAISRVMILEADFDEFNARQYNDLSSLCESLDERGCEKSGVPFRDGFTPLEEEYDLCFEAAREIEDCTLVIEEADRFPWNLLPEYRRIVLRGRHWGVSIVALAPSATLIPLNLRRQARRIITFRQLYPDDVKELSKQIGPLAFLMAPDENGLYPLPEFFYIDWNSKTGAQIFDDKGRPYKKDLTSLRPPVTIPSRPARRAEVPGGTPARLAGQDIEPQGESPQ